MNRIKKLEELEKKLENGEKPNIKEINMILEMSKEIIININNRCTVILNRLIYFLFITLIGSPFFDKSEISTKFLNYLLISILIPYSIYMLIYVLNVLSTTSRMKKIERLKEEISNG